jgi:indolepyruvate ferredoxin oxidoreductase beta subunit
MRDMNIIVCGVGGQGILFLTKLLAETAISMKKKVISTEIRGMSQMLGSVSAMMRIGNHESVGFAHADVILSMEPLEALRYSHMLSDDGLAITSDNEVMIQDYPDNILDSLKAMRSIIVNTRSLSGKRDRHLRDNVILFGVFCKKFSIPREIAEKAIKVFRDSEKNLAAFSSGFGHEV